MTGNDRKPEGQERTLRRRTGKDCIRTANSNETVRLHKDNEIDEPKRALDENEWL